VTAVDGDDPDTPSTPGASDGADGADGADAPDGAAGRRAARLPYETASAFRAALKARFVDIARADPRYTFDELARQFAYDRVLARCFSADDAEAWILKGAGALLARVPGARHSKDLDLYYDRRSRLPEAAVGALTAVLDSDIGDHFRFEVTKVSPLQEGLRGNRVHLTAYLGAPHSSFHVDLVVGTAMTGTPEIVPPLTPLVIDGLVRPPYRVFPLSDHCADKLCAIVETHHQAGVARVSTRVKDLVDLALIAATQTLDAASLHRALVAGAAYRRIPLPDRFAVPDWTSWRAGYPRTARSAPIAAVSFDAAVALVRRFLDPVLAGRAGGVWDPAAARWRGPSASDPVASDPVAASDPSGASGEAGPPLRAGPAGGEQAQRPGPDDDRRRQVGDRVAVGVERERPVGVHGQPPGTHDLDVRGVDVAAGEHLREEGEERQLAGPAGEHDVEQAVVDVGVRREAHPAAVIRAVRRGDRPADHVAWRPVVERDREAGRLPCREGAQRRVPVHVPAVDEPGSVRDDRDVGVEPDARDAQERPPVGLGEVDAAFDGVP
jgi:hypothetical protein